MRKEFIEEMKKMHFSPQFLRSIPFYRRGWIFSVHNSEVNAEVDFNGRVQNTKSYFSLCGGYYLPVFRKTKGVEFIYANEIFSIYRKIKKNKKENYNAFIVYNKRIIATLFYNYESSPTQIVTKINANGQDYEITFLSFLDEKETIAIVSIENIPQAFTGLPFAITSATGNEAELYGALKATFSIDILYVTGGLVFSF
jgi:hypothetical protein